MQEYQTGVDNLIAVAKQITNTEFLLQLRNLDMPDRKVMKKLLEFLTDQIKFEVSQRTLINTKYLLNIMEFIHRTI